MAVKKNLVFVIGSLSTGGAEAQLEHLATALTHGTPYTVSVITFYPGGQYWQRLQEQGVTVSALFKKQVLPKWRRLINWGLIPLYLRQRWRVYLKESPELSVVSVMDFANLLTYFSAYRLNLKLIWKIEAANSQLLAKYWKLYVVDYVCGLLSSRVAAVIYNSGLGQLIYRQRFRFHEANSLVIHNGIASEEFKRDEGLRQQMRAHYGWNDEMIVIGMVGRLTPVKGYELAFEAFIHLNKLYPKTKLIILGSGNKAYTHHLQAFIRERHAENTILLLGEKRQQQLPAYYNAMDIFLHAAYSESIGNVILEAMAIELPCIMTQVGDLPNYLPSGNHITCVGQIAPITSALEQLIKLDSPERQAIGRQNRAQVLAHFTVERMVAEFLKAVES